MFVLPSTWEVCYCCGCCKRHCFNDRECAGFDCRCKTRRACAYRAILCEIPTFLAIGFAFGFIFYYATTWTHPTPTDALMIGLVFAGLGVCCCPLMCQNMRDGVSRAGLNLSPPRFWPADSSVVPGIQIRTLMDSINNRRTQAAAAAMQVQVQVQVDELKTSALLVGDAV